MNVKRAILIVDDEAILLLSIRQELRLRFGTEYHYETALNAELGLRAIDRLAEEGIRLVLVISDWLMPGMRGDAFLKLVHERRPEVKLVMLSGHADRAQMEELAASTGLFACMSKPYQSSVLFDTVNRAMALSS